MWCNLPAHRHTSFQGEKIIDRGGAPWLVANQANRTELLKKFAAVY
jgi:hypothetical protein